MVSAVDAATGRTLLQEAVARGFSAEGEIFTLSQLAALATGRCGLAAETVVLRPALRRRHAGDGGAGRQRCRPGEAELGPVALAAALAGGALLALPYDRDQAGGGGPCAKGGYSSHYALVFAAARRGGAAAGRGEVDEGTEVEGSSSSSSSEEGWAFVALHGMASGPVVARYEDWQASNAQLLAADPEQLALGRWVFPASGAPRARSHYCFATAHPLHTTFAHILGASIIV